MHCCDTTIPHRRKQTVFACKENAKKNQLIIDVYFPPPAVLIIINQMYLSTITEIAFMPSTTFADEDRVEQETRVR